MLPAAAGRRHGAPRVPADGRSATSRTAFPRPKCFCRPILIRHPRPHARPTIPTGEAVYTSEASSTAAGTLTHERSEFYCRRPSNPRAKRVLPPQALYPRAKRVLPPQALYPRAKRVLPPQASTHERSESYRRSRLPERSEFYRRRHSTPEQSESSRRRHSISPQTLTFARCFVYKPVKTSPWDEDQTIAIQIRA